MLRTLQMIMRYHFGSLVFGSLVLLLVQFLEYFMEVIIFSKLVILFHSSVEI
jgi:hypothetical protein